MRKAFAIVCAAGVAAPALANHYGYWNNSQDFYVAVNYMPDFDQKRDSGAGVFGLPNDGAAYCAPTAIANMFAYIERHGFANNPGVDGPGVQNWADSSDTAAYNTATLFINSLGVEMNTHPQDGTTSYSDVASAVDGRLSNTLFTVSVYFRTDRWAPTVSTIADYMRQGGINMFCFGRWDVDFGGATPRLVDRASGHCVTMTKVDKRAGFGYGADEYVINFCDPASGGSSETDQSNFVHSVVPIVDVAFRGTEPIAVPMSTFDVSPSDGRVRIIDGCVGIYPKAAWGVWPTNDSIAFWQGGSFDLTYNPNPAPNRAPSLVTYGAPEGSPIFDTLLAPDRGSAVVATLANPATGEAGSLYTLELGSGVFHHVQTLANPAGMAFGRDLSLFVVQNPTTSGLATIKRFMPDELASANDPSQQGPVGSISVPATAVAGVAYDDVHDRLAMLVTAVEPAGETVGGSSRVVLLYDPSIIGGFPFRTIVPRSDTVDFDAEMIAFDPATGGLLIADAATGAVALGDDGGEGAWRLIHGGGARIDAITPIGDGLVRVAPAAGDAFVIEPSGGALYAVTADEDLPPIARAMFLSGGRFTHNSTNFDPRLHQGPEWNNVDPDDLLPAPATTADCLVDFARPFEQLDIADVVAFLERFGDGDATADLAAPFGALDIADVVAFLQLFGAGCP